MCMYLCSDVYIDGCECVKDLLSMYIHNHYLKQSSFSSRFFAKVHDDKSDILYTII